MIKKVTKDEPNGANLRLINNKYDGTICMTEFKTNII